MKNDRVRLQIDMTKERIKSIDELKTITGLGSRKEVLDNALAIFSWAISETQEGRNISSINGDCTSFKQLVMPCIESARNHNRKG